MKSIGIIGFGEFGRFVAGLIPTNIDVLIKSSGDVAAYEVPPKARAAELEEMGSCDAVILAIPLEAHEKVLTELKPNLKPNTLVVDVCSVKTKSEAVIDKVLPDHAQIVCSHPLFGPQSAAKSAAGMPMVVTRSRGERAEFFLEFCEHYLRLAMHHMTAEEHDKQMALVHALTFFTARGLLRMDVHEVGLITPSFQKILDLVALESHHSEELFKTIQQGNPYAGEVRQKFIATLTQLESEL